MLESVISMQLIVEKIGNTNLQSEIILPLNKKRKTLSTNVILLTHLLSSSIIKKSPLPSILPSVSKSQKSVAKQIITLPVITQSERKNDILSYVFYVNFFF